MTCRRRLGIALVVTTAVAVAVPAVLITLTLIDRTPPPPWVEAGILDDLRRARVTFEPAFVVADGATPVAFAAYSHLDRASFLLLRRARREPPMVSREGGAHRPPPRHA